MNFKAELSIENTYENSERIAFFVMKLPNLLENLFEVFWGENKILTQRASLPIIICAKRKPNIIKPFVEKMILTLQKGGINDTIKRNTVRILAEFPIPKHMEGIITEICFKYMHNSSEAIAIKAFSMIILEKMAIKHPELKTELIYLIETGMEFGSPGYKSRGGKILAKLKR